MKAMFSPFDFELVVKNNSSSFTDYLSGKNCFLSDNTFCEPISVLDSRIPSGPTSSSTLSSSLGGGSSGGGGAASTDTAGVAAVSDRNPSPKWQHQDSTTATSSSAGVDSELIPVPPSLEVAVSGGGGGGSAEKCVMEDWESVLSETAAASPGQEQSIYRWIMGDVEDPTVGTLNKFLQFGGGAAPTAAEFDLSGGLGVMDQAFTGGANFVSNLSNRSSSEKIDSAANLASLNPNKFHQNSQNLMFPSSVANNFGAISFHNPPAFDSSAETKPSIFNPQLLMNQHQAQNLSFFLPFPYAQEQEQSAPSPPPAKRLNSGGQIPRGPFVDAMFNGRQQLNHQQQQQLPPYLHHRPKLSGGDELQQQQQQAIIDQLYKAAELLQAGNPALAQGILARLNHHLSPIGNPFHRAAFYCKEALQLLLHSTTTNSSAADSSPLSLVFKIGAYKAFSEVSPLIEFANFTCNQSLLEAVEGFDRIHIVDFDIGYGGQWASLMQELALRSGGAPLLKITALVSHTTHDQLELSLTRENLIQFANEINVGFEFDIMSIDSLSSASWSMPFHLNENEAVAVNIPIGCLTNYQLSAPLALRFVKQLSPRIVVSIDRGCDRTDLPFPSHIIHALQSYSSLLESLDAVNVNVDALQKIERFLLQPGLEKLVMSRFRAPEKSQHWRNLFLSCGFSPVMFSNFTESQAECVVKRTPVRGFQVEKRQSSLVLCWQRKELVSASVWRCSSL